MTPEMVETLFRGKDGGFRFARWGRPIAPVVFGVTDETLATLKGAIEAVVALAGHRMAETDPELGANLMVFFFRDWAELTSLAHLDRLVPDLDRLCTRLAAEGANQYRLFRLDDAGAIRAAFVFLRVDEALAEVAAEDLALHEAVQVILLWGEGSLAAQGVLARARDGTALLRPEITALIRVAYDPVLPGASRDGAHALRLWARMGLGDKQP